MRLPVIILSALMISAPAASAGPAAAPAVEKPAEATSDTCRRPTSYYAGKGSVYRGEPAQPRKLTELPAGVGYMAVYRTVNGCEEPMTVVEYRTGRRP